MDLVSFSESAPSYACSECGRSFAGLGLLNFHWCSCRTTKRQIQGALVKAKVLWEVRKRSKGLDEPQVVGSSTPDLPSQTLLGLSLSMAIMTTTPGSNAAAFIGVETESPPPPVSPTHVQSVLTQSEMVCRRWAIGQDRSLNIF